MSEHENVASAEQSSGVDEARILTQLVSALQPLSTDTRGRLLRTLATFFEINLGQLARTSVPTMATSSVTSEAPTFSQDRTTTPKQFLYEKKPVTDVDRVACLAYYLTHYRETPFFKTLDISKLNTEAAQIKFANATYAVDNATRAGLLAAALKGQKQISAIGERYVATLPDRSTAREVLEAARRRRNRKPKVSTGEKEPTDQE
jgi:hypothetical protein